MRTLLIDADTLIFSASTASEYECQWSEWLYTLHSDFNEARDKFEASVHEIVESLRPDKLIFALSDELRFRPMVMPTYKHNRKGRKPIVYQPLREYVQETRDTYMKPWLEGDDVLGILATHPKLVEGEKIVVSIDKDMQTIPGLHVNYGKAPGEIATVSEEEADYNWMMQTLTGDKTDGYPGVPGVGPVKAEKIIGGMTDLGEMWPAVVRTYVKAGLSEEVALQNARVARILRHTDYDYKAREVILWTP